MKVTFTRYKYESSIPRGSFTKTIETDLIPMVDMIIEDLAFDDDRDVKVREVILSIPDNEYNVRLTHYYTRDNQERFDQMYRDHDWTVNL